MNMELIDVAITTVLGRFERIDLLIKGLLSYANGIRNGLVEKVFLVT